MIAAPRPPLWNPPLKDEARAAHRAAVRLRYRQADAPRYLGGCAAGEGATELELRHRITALEADNRPFLEVREAVAELAAEVARRVRREEAVQPRRGTNGCQPLPLPAETVNPPYRPEMGLKGIISRKEKKPMTDADQINNPNPRFRPSEIRVGSGAHFENPGRKPARPMPHIEPPAPQPPSHFLIVVPARKKEIPHD